MQFFHRCIQTSSMWKLLLSCLKIDNFVLWCKLLIFPPQFNYIYSISSTNPILFLVSISIGKPIVSWDEKNWSQEVDNWTTQKQYNRTNRSVPQPEQSVAHFLCFLQWLLKCVKDCYLNWFDVIFKCSFTYLQYAIPFELFVASVSVKYPKFGLCNSRLSMNNKFFLVRWFEWKP